MNKRFAVCVGINDYPGSGADLSGCVNDALGWADLLRGLGSDTLLLLNSEATKANVFKALIDAVDKARFGDRIYFTYSGHGSWVPAKGDDDEPDGRDECLCLYDYQSGGLLLDDEIHDIFSTRRYGVRAYIISDSCHSGTMSRLVAINGPLLDDSGVVQGVPRFLPPATFLDDQDLAKAKTVAWKEAKAKPRPTTVLLSGCDDPEYSYDAFIDGIPQGAFSYHALKTYIPGQRLSLWHQRIRGSLPSAAYPQAPQLIATSWQKRWSL